MDYGYLFTIRFRIGYLCHCCADLVEDILNSSNSLIVRSDTGRDVIDKLKDGGLISFLRLFNPDNCLVAFFTQWSSIYCWKVSQNSVRALHINLYLLCKINYCKIMVYVS